MTRPALGRNEPRILDSSPYARVSISRSDSLKETTMMTNALVKIESGLDKLKQEVPLFCHDDDCAS